MHMYVCEKKKSEFMEKMCVYTYTRMYMHVCMYVPVRMCKCMCFCLVSQ